MSISNLNWREALRVVRVGRKIANPNTGFQLQLQDFENNKVDEERRRMKERFPSLAIHESDQEYMYRALEHFDTMIASRDLCHYNCKRNENCPTGTWMLHELALWVFYSFALLCIPCLRACEKHKRHRHGEMFNLRFYLISFIDENIIENEKFAYFEISHK